MLMLSKLLCIHFGHISPETFPLPTLGSTLINLSRELHFGRGFLVYSVLSQLTPTHPFMALFDFAPYLSSFLSVPTKNIYIRPLLGGLSNFTVRATFTPPAQFRQSRILSSVVLKYAPPFFAANPTQPMSFQRQVVEAQALTLLSGGLIASVSQVLFRFPHPRAHY